MPADKVKNGQVPTKQYNLKMLLKYYTMCQRNTDSFKAICLNDLPTATTGNTADDGSG